MKQNTTLYIGIMSGTSLDGVDAALVDLSGPQPRLLASHYQPYPDALKATLLTLHHASPGELHLAQVTANLLAHEYAQATLQLLSKSSCTAQEIQAIGCHGQTLRHRPEFGYTLQLNNPALLAELTQISVVADFRSRDIAAGGQGAPLVPAFHDKVLRHPEIHRCILNIGGIANLTDLPPGQPTSGFDTGPGNLLMDAWIARHLARPYDKNGEWARSGTSLPNLLTRLMAEPYLEAAPPKSSGRDLFNLAWLNRHLDGHEDPADVQATLLALTGDSISQALTRYCRGATELYVCGGGAHNQTLMNHLQQNLPECRVLKTDVAGISVDWMEAIAFAWLAQQTLARNPANLPAVTGARHPCVLGAIYPA